MDQPVMYKTEIMGPTARKGLVTMGQPAMYRAEIMAPPAIYKTEIMGPTARKGLCYGSVRLTASQRT